MGTLYDVWEEWRTGQQSSVRKFRGKYQITELVAVRPAWTLAVFPGIDGPYHRGDGRPEMPLSESTVL